MSRSTHGPQPKARRHPPFLLCCWACISIPLCIAAHVHVAQVSYIDKSSSSVHQRLVIDAQKRTENLKKKAEAKETKERNQAQVLGTPSSTRGGCVWLGRVQSAVAVQERRRCCGC